MESIAPQNQIRPGAAGQPEEPVFDASSGFSLEEQREILDGINAIAPGGRFSGEAPEIKAEKNGVIFPLFVNICVFLVLGLGFFLLFFLHGQDDQNIRAGFADLGLTERKLIEEIRLETGRQLSEKDEEINDILSKLSNAETEYQSLQGSVENLTEEQKERSAALLKMQDEYRNTLSGLEEEKSRILENSRQQESALRAQAEERAKTLSTQVEQSQASLSAAMEELLSLGAERERAAMAERQMSGFYASLGNQLKSGNLDDASRTMEAMKDFFFAASRENYFSDAGKQSHLAAITAIDDAIGDARGKMDAGSGRNTATPAAGDETGSLREKITELEAQASLLGQKASDQEKAIALMSSQGSDQGRMIAEYLSEIDTLRTANSNQQQTLNRRDSELVSIRAENEENAKKASDLGDSIAALRTQLQNANDRISEMDASLADQKNEYDDLLAQKNEIQRQYDDFQRRVDTALRVVTED